MSDTADLIFQVAKANVESAQVAFQSGYDAGFKAGHAEGRHIGYLEAIKFAKGLVEDTMPKVSA